MAIFICAMLQGAESAYKSREYPLGYSQFVGSGFYQSRNRRQCVLTLQRKRKTENFFASSRANCSSFRETIGRNGNGTGSAKCRESGKAIRLVKPNAPSSH